MGGKWRLAPWIIDHIPPHVTYVEPYGGGASVLLRKPRSRHEVLNDLRGDLVNLFRVLRDQGDALARAVLATPFARDEFDAALEPTDDPVEWARRTVVRSMQGQGGYGGRPQTGFRSSRRVHGPSPSREWADLPHCLRQVAERLRGVVIEHRDAVEILRQHDDPTTLAYVDPPYVQETRGPDRYTHDMDDAGHRALAEALRSLRGMVVLSGYPCALYDELYPDWRRVEREARSDRGGARTECLWLSPATAAALDAGQQRLDIA